MLLWTNFPSSEVGVLPLYHNFGRSENGPCAHGPIPDGPEVPYKQYVALPHDQKRGTTRCTLILDGKKIPYKHHTLISDGRDEAYKACTRLPDGPAEAYNALYALFWRFLLIFTRVPHFSTVRERRTMRCTLFRIVQNYGFGVVPLCRTVGNYGMMLVRHFPTVPK